MTKPVSSIVLNGSHPVSLVGIPLPLPPFLCVSVCVGVVAVGGGGVVAAAALLVLFRCR